MINGDLNIFLDLMKRGEELIFTYKGQKFFLQGLYEPETDLATMYLDRWEPKPCIAIWESKPTHDSFFDIEEFCNAKLFDGKSFWEIESEVEWVDC